ncbi:MAG: LysR family transcriptional regulator [Janthinobacterium lividum]
MNSSARPTFEWHLIQSFLATFECGSLLGASRRLNISQPTIGRHIAALEHQLGAALFERTGRGLAPTAAAHAIAAAARRMDSEASDIFRLASSFDERDTGTVRVTASQFAACYLLPPLLAELRLQCPGIAVELVASNALSNLLLREADIAVRMAAPEQSALIARRLGIVSSGIYAHRLYLDSHGAPATPVALLDHALVGLDGDDAIIRECRSRGLLVTRDHFVLRTDDHVALAQSVAAGIGIGFLPNYVAASLPGLQRLFPEVTLPGLPLWLAVHREIHATSRIRIVYDFLAGAVTKLIHD